MFLRLISNRKKINCFNMNKIFDDRFIFEEGVYWTYTTDEKMKMAQKDIHIEASYFLKITKRQPESGKERCPSLRSKVM